MNQQEYEKSLEFLVARASDPFASSDTKKEYAEILFDRIDKEYDGANEVIKILSHKLLSPNQNEALNSLELMDLCVRRCGIRVINEIAKFRILNQFIRLLSPKFQGLQTSTEVRDKAIYLLFNWKNSHRNCEKVRQVYDLLKEQCVFEEDPKVDEEILHLFKQQPRMAVFEDEEKAHLLEKLLKSKNPDDLQAANRLIKSLVRSETLKIEKVHKRSEDLETSSTNARVLQDMLEQLSQNQFNKMPGNNEQDNQDFTLMKDIYKTLLKMRPILFRYAGEAAENNEEILSEILSINDQLNRTLERYEEYAKNKIDGKFTTSNQHNSSDILITLDNGFANSNNCLLEEPTTSTSNDDVAILSLRSNPNSPSIQRRFIEKNYSDILTDYNFFEDSVVKPSGNIKNDQIAEESILRKIRLNGDDINAELTELNLNQEPVIIAKHDIDNLQKSKDQFLLEDVSLSLDNLIISSKEPVIFINQTFIKGVIYFAKNIAIGYKNIIFTVATLTSFNPLPITNIKLKMCSNSSLVSSKLLSTSQTNLKGFHPVAAPENISQVFMLLPLSDTVKQAEISFELLFKSNLGERIEGNFLLKWE